MGLYDRTRRRKPETSEQSATDKPKAPTSSSAKAEAGNAAIVSSGDIWSAPGYVLGAHAAIVAPNTPLALAAQTETERYHLDSGCTMTMVKTKEFITKLEKLPKPVEIHTAGGQSVHANEYGTLTLPLNVNGDFRWFTIPRVLYSPHLSNNLISVSQLAEAGVDFKFSKTDCIAFHGTAPVLSATRVGGLYDLDVEHVMGTARRVALAATTGTPTEILHRRLGHMSASAMKKLARDGLVQGIDLEACKKDFDCEICIQAKATRTPFPSSETAVKDLLEIVHSDVCGPFNESLGRAKYFVTFIDDKSRMTWLYPMHRKSEVFAKFKEFKALVENQTGQTIRTLRTDNGALDA